MAKTGQSMYYSGRTVNNLVSWTWDKGSKGTRGGDSGGPMYRVQASGKVTGVGIHVAGNKADTSWFVPLATELSATGSALVKS